MTQERVEENFISLADIIRMVYKQRWVFLGLFLIFFVVGTFFVLKQKPKYIYKQQFVMSHYYDGSDYKAVASIYSIESQLTNYVLPALIDTYNQQHPNQPVDISMFKDAIKTSKATPYSIDFHLSLEKNPTQQRLYDYFANSLFSQAKQIEQMNVNVFKTNLKQYIDLIQQQLPAFKRLQQMEMKIDESVPSTLKAKAGLQEIRDMYISSLGANANYSAFYDMLQKLNDNQQKLQSLVDAKQSQVVIQSKDPMSKSLMLVAAFILAFIMSFLVVLCLSFIKNSLSKDS